MTDQIPQAPNPNAVMIACRATPDCKGRSAVRVGQFDMIEEARKEVQKAALLKGLPPEEAARLREHFLKERQDRILAGEAVPSENDVFLAQIAEGGAGRARFQCLTCKKVFEIPY